MPKMPKMPQMPKMSTTTTIVDGNEVRVITNGKDYNTDINMDDVSSDIDFMKQFGNLRVAFLDAIKDSEKKALQTGIVIKIVELCKKQAHILNNNERSTCQSSVSEMIRIIQKTNPDTFMTGMLNEANEVLGKK